MMMTRTRTIFIAVLCTAAGVLCGRLLHPARSLSHGETSGTTGGPHRPSRAAPPVDTDDPRDLRSLKKYALRLRNGADPVIARQVERLGTAELRGIIAEISRLETSLEGDKKGDRNLLKAAAGELYRREGLAALDALRQDQSWAGLGVAMCVAAADSPAAVKAWAEAQPSAETAPGESRVGAAAEQAALRAAISRGAEDVLQVLAAFPSATVGDPSGAVGKHFPEDFDFARMHEGSRGISRFMSGAMASWASRDREAAWQATRSLPERDVMNFILYGAIAAGGEADGVTWFLGKLGELTPQARLEVTGFPVFAGMLTGDGVATAIPLLSTEEKQDFAAMLIANMREEESIHRLLESLPRESVIQAFTKVAGFEWTFFGSDLSHREAYKSRLAEKFHLTPEELKTINATE